MRILIVDDDVELLVKLQRRIMKISASVDCAIASNVSDAHAELALSPPDVCIVDLQLPSANNSHDAAIEMGEALVRDIAFKYPGTFIILYSGFSENSITDPLYEQLNARRPNVLGTVEPAMFVNRPKQHPLKAVQDIEDIFRRRKELTESVALEDYQVANEVSGRHLQIFRAFGKFRGAATMRVSQLHGGKSGAKVYAVVYFDRDGNTLLQTVVKVDHWSEVQTEEQKYESYVAGMLTMGTYAPLLNRTAFVCADIAGMFYEEITPRVGDFSMLWGASPTDLRTVIGRLQAIERRWTDNAVAEEVRIGDLRRALISDAELADIASGLPFSARVMDDEVFRIRVCLQHGDFHAGNVLLTEGLLPYFLDFASIGRFPKPFDPLTLELAYVFNNPLRSVSAWPDEAAIRRWHEPDVYFENCPAREALTQIRAWTRNSTIGFAPTGVYATVYSYALRQLKYKDTDKKLATALAETMLSLLRGGS